MSAFRSETVANRQPSLVQYASRRASRWKGKCGWTSWWLFPVALLNAPPAPFKDSTPSHWCVRNRVKKPKPHRSTARGSRWASWKLQTFVLGSGRRIQWFVLEIMSSYQKQSRYTLRAQWWCPVVFISAISSRWAVRSRWWVARKKKRSWVTSWFIDRFREPKSRKHFTST